MRRLRGADAGFLYVESPTQPTVNVYAAVIRPPRGPDGSRRALTLADVRAHVARRLGDLPSFRQRLAPVSYGLHHPLVIEDPDFDLGYHLRHETLPAPGSESDFDRVIARLSSTPLDRGHPLWQITLLDGLAGGHQALALSIHHAINDGTAAVTTLERLLSGDDYEPETPADSWRPERPPSRRRMVTGAMADHARSVRGLPRLIGDTRRGVAAVSREHDECDVKVPVAIVDMPHVVFNEAFTIRRELRRTGLPLADLQRVKRAAGVTFNDVALAVVSGAVRDYLEVRGVLPTKSVMVNVPVATDPPDSPRRQYGNHFANIMTTLATDVPDPWQRLATIAAVTKQAKTELGVLGDDLLSRWLDGVPPLVAEPVYRRFMQYRRRHPERADGNLVVSNVRTRADGWCFGKATVTELLIAGPVVDGAGLNITVNNFGDHLRFAIMANPDVVDAPDELVEGLHRSLAVLLAAIDQRAEAAGKAGGAAAVIDLTQADAVAVVP